MTQHQYEILRKLQRIFRLKRLFVRKKGEDVPAKQSETEHAERLAVGNRPIPSDE